MPLAGFEPIISAGEWPQTYALDRAATGTGHTFFSYWVLLFIDAANLIKTSYKEWGQIQFQNSQETIRLSVRLRG